MATRLTKEIVRMVDHDGTTYKVILSGDGVRITRKGGRLPTTWTWDDLLHGRDVDVEGAAPAILREQTAPKLGMQDTVAADVLLLMRKANDTLSEATRLIDAASSLPSLIASHRQPPEPREEERSDWYIEPLLSVQQVSRILGVTTRKVRNLAIPKILIEGEARFHPADIRRFVASGGSSASRPNFFRTRQGLLTGATRGARLCPAADPGSARDLRVPSANSPSPAGGRSASLTSESRNVFPL
jgi:hypothetical protein